MKIQNRFLFGPVLVLNLLIGLAWVSTSQAATPAQQLAQCISEALQQQAISGPQNNENLGDPRNVQHSGSRSGKASDKEANLRQQELFKRQCSEQLHQQDRQRAQQRYLERKQKAARNRTISATATVASNSSVLGALAATGGISGTVTDTSGTGIQGVWVYAEYWNGNYWEQDPNYAFTDAAGQYEITGLDDRTYRIKFRDNTESHAYEIYNNADFIESGTDIIVTNGAITPNINTQLGDAGHISGTVGDFNGDPVESIRVRALRWNGESWPEISSTTTDALGHYDLGGLRTGNYRLDFEPNSGVGPSDLVPEYYPDVQRIDDATDINVTEGSTTNIDAQLAQAGQISGTVTDSSGNPLANISVSAEFWNGSYWQSGTSSTSTDSSGHYELGGLAANDYRVQFFDFASAYINEYYDDVTDIDQATDVTVTAGGSTSINAELALAAHITGTVTDTSGNPLANIMIGARSWNGNWWSYVGSQVYTDATGHYDQGGLPAGTYRIQFNDNNGTYLQEFYDNATSVETGADIVVAAESTVPAINAELAVGSHITGTVTDTNGDPLANISVSAYKWEVNGGNSGGSSVGTPVTTDVNGHYDQDGLAAGNYRIEFRDDNGDYLQEVYNDATTVQTGTDIVVAEESTTPNIDAQLALAGHITGTVTDANGDPIAGIRVVAYTDQRCWFDYITDASTDADGHYDIGGLRSGDYLIHYEGDSDHQGEVYDDISDETVLDRSLENGTPVAVTVGASTNGIDARLSDAAHITGTVTDTNGAPIEGYYIKVLSPEVFSPEGNGWGIYQWFEARTDSSGNYDVGGLVAGTYRIEVAASPFSALIENVSEFYNNAADVDSATDIVVTSGGTVSGINLELTPAGFVAGTVSNGSNGLPSINVRASCWNGSEWKFIDNVFSDANGDYTIGGLPAGSCHIEFSGNNDYASAVSGDVTITQDQTTSGVDATLAPAGHITGTITSGGQAVGSFLVDVLFWDGSDWSSTDSVVFTDANGHYDAGGLATGTYRLRFGDSNGYGGYVSEVYNNVQSPSAGTDISVTAGSTTPNIDADLEAAGSISGTVTADSGSPLGCIVVTAYDQDGSSWTEAGQSVFSDIDGSYNVTGLASGNHRLEFQDELALYQEEVYDNAATLDTGTDVATTTGTTTSGIDAVLSEAGASPPSAPILIAPNGSDVDTQPTYRWNPVAGADSYQLWVTDATGDVITTWYDANVLGCAGGSGTCSIAPTTSLAVGDVDWWVRGRNANGEGPFSGKMEFEVLAGPIPGPATLTSPQGMIATDTPTYRWEAVADSTDYLLQVDDDTGTPIKQWYTADQAHCSDGTGTCSVTPTTAVSGNATWWIQTWNSNGTGPWSNEMEFYPEGTIAPGAATLVSPTGTGTDTTPSYTWNAVPEATWYYLWVSNDSNGQQSKQWYSAAEAGCETGTGTCSVTPTTEVKDANTWWVQTWNDIGTGPWSTELTFTVTGTAPIAPTQIAPSGAIVSTMPTYTWNAAANATWYYLWVQDSTGTPIKTWYTADQAGCGDGTGTCSLTPNTEIKGSVTWWVESWSTFSTSETWSDGLSFSEPGGVPSAAELVSPSGAADPLPTYTWDAEPRSTWYFLWAEDGNGNSIQEWYSAADAGCADGTGTCSITPTVALQGPSQWWIQTWNTYGTGDWSAAMDFTPGNPDE